MTQQLIVTKSFLSFVRGDIIFDCGKVSEILSTEHKRFVTKVNVPTTSKG